MSAVLWACGADDSSGDATATTAAPTTTAPTTTSVPPETTAEPQWDFVCEQDHGCEPLPLTRDQFEALQAADPRPRG